MKQVDIIERTGINKGALSSYLSGRYLPKQDNIYKLAKALDVNPAWLMGLDVPMEMPQGQSLHISVDKDDVTEEVLSLVFDDEKQVKEFMNFYKVFKDTNPKQREAILSLLESPKSDS